MEPKKLYRNEDNRVIAGVCSGVAEYFNIDPTIVRIIWAVVCLCYGTGLILYLVCALVIPVKPNTFETKDYVVKESKVEENTDPIDNKEE